MPPAFGEPFESRGDVDAGAVDVFGVDPDIADVHAHPERDRRCAGRSANNAANAACISSAAFTALSTLELRKETVAGELDDSAAIARAVGSMTCPYARGAMLRRRGLVELHEARVTRRCRRRGSRRAASEAPLPPVQASVIFSAPPATIASAEVETGLVRRIELPLGLAAKPAVGQDI